MLERCRNTWKMAQKNLAPERRSLGIFAEAQRRSTFQLTVSLSQAGPGEKTYESMTRVNYSFPDLEEKETQQPV